MKRNLLLILAFCSLITPLLAQKRKFTLERYKGVYPPPREANYIKTTIPFPTLPTTGNGSSGGFFRSHPIVSTDATDVRLNSLSIYPQTEPHISINKTSPQNILVSINTSDEDYNNGHPNSNQGYYYSTNGGSSWTGSDFLPNESSSYGLGDPSTCYDAQGYGYLATLLPSIYYLPDPPVMDKHPVGYGVQRTTDNGATWQTQKVSGDPLQQIATDWYPNVDKEMITCDDVSTSPYVNNFYAAWTDFGANNTNYIMVNESRDGLTTFETPITLRNATGLGFGANVQTGPAGQVYVAWAEYGTNIRAGSIRFTKSTDDWATHTTSTAFSYTGIAAGTGTGWFTSGNSWLNNIRSVDYAAMAVDKSCGENNGRIYIAYAENTSTNTFTSRIKVRYSDDEGSTWSTGTIVNIADGRQNYMPWIAVDDATGLVCVAYYSLDCYTCVYTDPNYYSTNMYLAYSDDGGANWGNQLVSDVSFTTKAVPGWGAYMGDYIGVTAYGGKAYVSWMDNRIGTTSAAQVQTYVSQVSFNSPIIHSSVNDINISGPVTIASGEHVRYESGGTITAPVSSTYTVTAGADVTMKATNSVVLQNEFFASDEFYAYTEAFTPCSNASPYRKAVDPIVPFAKKPENTTLDFIAYPNPTTGSFHVRTNNKLTTEKSVIISDMLGKIVWESKNDINESLDIDLSNQPSGLYFIKITQDEKVHVKKIIKQ